MRTRSTHSNLEESKTASDEGQSGYEGEEKSPIENTLDEDPTKECEVMTPMPPNDTRPNSAADLDVEMNGPDEVVQDGKLENEENKREDMENVVIPDHTSQNSTEDRETESAESVEESDQIKASDVEEEDTENSKKTSNPEISPSHDKNSSDIAPETTTETDATPHESDGNNESSEQKEQSKAPFGIFPPFAPNPASFFTGQLHSEFAKSFYNSLSLLASQAMMNVKQEPKECTRDGLPQAPSDGDNLQIPPRNDSRSSDASANSYDERQRGQDESFHQKRSPAPSNGNGISNRVPSGFSPKSLAEQLRNNDSVSMVVSRQSKFPGRNQGFSRPLYANSTGHSSPPPPSVFHPLASDSPPPRPHEYMPLPHSNMAPSSSLHHFTTRYTIELPADPSRLGVELVLDHDNDEPVIEVECGGNRGLLYINKLCQGSKGQSIHFNDEWLTPNEFQFISGRETAKDWKRSIRHCGKSLKTLMTKGILQVHPPVCECGQCRGLHGGNKLLSGKKTPLKDNNNIISKRPKSSPSFPVAPDSSHSDTDDMTRHGLEGGLNSIISQLRKANGFDGNDVGGSLDLSSKAQDRNDASSPEFNSRKRSRDDSPEPRRPKEEVDDDRISPAPKRPYSRQDEYSRNPIDPSSFAASYSFLSPEEQYRRMLALMSRTMSPAEQQRQLLTLAQNMADPMASNFGDISGLANALQASAMYNERVKSKYKANRDNSEESGHPYDLTRKISRKPADNTNRRPVYGFTTPDKYRKPDRQTPTPSRGDSKYIALEQRQRDERLDHPSRDDIRSWTASRHAAMIDLNSNASSHSRTPEWAHRSPWLSERNQNSGKHPDIKSSPGKNGAFNGFFQENMTMDRVPISKTPVTTLHHRPSANHAPDSELQRCRHKGYPGENHHRSHNNKHDSSARNTPMLDLKKHAVPMLSLKRPTQDELFGPPQDRSLRKRLSNNSDQEMRDINENGESASLRQSSSAPPPHVSPRETTRETRRPTSAQDRLHPAMSHRESVTSQCTTQRPTSSSVGDVMDVPPYESYLQKKSIEVQLAFDEMRKWTTEDVCKFLKEVDPTLEEYIENFKEHEIDGEGLPLLTDRHLMEIMDIKLGCALKVVARIRRALKILPESLTCHHASYLPPLTNRIDSANSKPSKSSSGSPEEKKEDEAVPNNKENSVENNE